MKIIDVINLFYYDNNPAELYNKLFSLKKDSFEVDEKIVIVHPDTDYYYFNCPIGFAINNLFNCWKEADLPFNTMLLIANHSHLSQAIKSYYKINEYDHPTVISEFFNYDTIQRNLTEPFTNPIDITYPAVCFNGGAQRPHRIKIYQYLKKYNLLDCVRTNFGSVIAIENELKGQNIPNSKQAVNTAASRNLDTADIIITQPVRINLTGFKFTTNQQINELHTVPLDPHQDTVLARNKIKDVYHLFFMDVISETMFDSPHVFISEKTIRAIANKKPFIMYNAANTLEYLHSFGFKTFSDFWDESYDTIQDYEERFLATSELVKTISLKPIDELREMYYNMQEILNYNVKVLKEQEKKCLELFRPITKFAKK